MTTTKLNNRTLLYAYNALNQQKENRGDPHFQAALARFRDYFAELFGMPCEIIFDTINLGNWNTAGTFQEFKKCCLNRYIEMIERKMSEII